MRVKKNKKKLFPPLILLLLLSAIFLFFQLTNNYKKRVLTKVCIYPSPAIVSEDNSIDKLVDPEDCNFQTYGENIEIFELDRASCKRVSDYVITDKNNVYKHLYDPGSSDYSDYIILHEADPATFQNLGWGYYKDSNYLFYDTGTGYEIVADIDLNSLEILSHHLIKDQNNIYLSIPYENPDLRILKGFDRKTFSNFEPELGREDYYKDKNGVYFSKDVRELDWENSRIIEADFDSFHTFGPYRWAMDKNHVYREGQIVEGADPKSFVYLEGGSYFKDNNNVYTELGGFRRMLERDGCTFELVNYSNQYEWLGYSKDKNNVYYREWTVPGADPESFRVEGEKAFDKHSSYKGIYRE